MGDNSKQSMGSSLNLISIIYSASSAASLSQLGSFKVKSHSPRKSTLVLYSWKIVQDTDLETHFR